jgi:hypothetical protein
MNIKQEANHATVISRQVPRHIFTSRLVSRVMMLCNLEVVTTSILKPEVIGSSAMLVVMTS